MTVSKNVPLNSELNVFCEHFISQAMFSFDFDFFVKQRNSFCLVSPKGKVIVWQCMMLEADKYDGNTGNISKRRLSSEKLKHAFNYCVLVVFTKPYKS